MQDFEITQAPLEIERKFLIAYPDIEILKRQPSYRKLYIEQTYLKTEADFLGGRIRCIKEGDAVRYIYTYKQKISDLTRYEYEKEISAEEYNELMLRRIEGSHTIVKDRHIFDYSGLTYELDIYAFWEDQATLEAEVDSEETKIPIPPFLQLIKEVTHDSRYNNSRLAFNLGVIEKKE